MELNKKVIFYLDKNNWIDHPPLYLIHYLTFLKFFMVR